MKGWLECCSESHRNGKHEKEVPCHEDRDGGSQACLISNQEDREQRGAETIFEKIMAENSEKLIKENKKNLGMNQSWGT